MDTDTIQTLERVKEFLTARMQMAAPGEAKLALAAWGRAVDDAIAELRAGAPHVLTREELADWTGDVWAEDVETGVVTAIDRSAVKAYRRYMRLDADSPKRLWTGRPSEEQREGTRW